MVVLLGYVRGVLLALLLVLLRLPPVLPPPKPPPPKPPPAETAASGAPASGLCIGLKRQAQTEPEDASEIPARICSLFDHICHVVSFSLVAVDPGCSHLEAGCGTPS